MRSNAAIAIIFSEDHTHVLLVKRKDIPLYVLPGGGIDPNETPEEAVIREVKEETGLSVEIIRKTASYTPINNLATPTEVFECSSKGTDFQLSDETTAIDFFPIANLPKNFFIIHKLWLQEARLNNTTIYRELKEISYLNFLKYFLQNPFQVLRFLYTMIGK